MSTRPIPSKAEVLAALAELRNEAQTTGRRPSVLALAHKVGLANTTFRRHFPDITTELTAPAPADQADSITTTRHHSLQNDNAKLRQTNRNLQENLELAIANIQRLTMENHRLLRELETSRQIPRIGPGQHPRARTPERP